ncbi:MAG: hypothetical protein JWN08_3055 [Frankiales bacterium]|nr:hypothetical protein [Frankiales bacterium]
MTNVRLASASALLLCLAGVFTLVRADDTMKTILGLVMLLSGASVAVSTRTADTQRGR